MNAFVWAATALAILQLPLLAVAVLRRPIDGLVALELSGVLLAATLMCLAEGFHRPFEYTLAIMAAVFGTISGLVYARFLGRWT
jgi:multisubunit Na+/H+ antiporter MnhF subunit